MRKQVYAATIGVLLVLSVFSVLQFWQIKNAQATSVFTDGFETGDFSAWTSNTTSGNGTASVTNSDPHHGTYHANFTTTNATDSGSCSKAVTSTNILYTRFQIKFLNYSIADGHYVYFAGADSGSWGYAANPSLQGTAGDPIWGLRVVEGGAADVYTNATSPVINTTYTVEYMRDVANDIETLWVNDQVTINATKAITENSTYSRIGPYASAAGFNRFFVDCVEVSTSKIGLESTVPTFTSIIANTTLAGNATQLTCTVSDNVGVSSYIYSTNNTGPWVNASAVAFSGVSAIATWNSTWNATVGNIVSAKLYANDTDDIWAVSSQYNFTLTSSAENPPLSSNYGTNTTVVTNASLFYCQWTDDFGLSTYAVEHNNTGTFANTTGALTGTSAWSNITVTLNATIGYVVAIRWHANDSSNQWSSTAWYNITLTTVTYGDAEEIRGVFIHESIFAFTHNWTLIAETLANYKIDSVYCHFANTHARRPDAEWTSAITAFHNEGIEFIACIAGPDETAYSEDTKWVLQDGSKAPWGDCPNNPTYLAAVKTNVEEIATLYDIDGVMYDYIRYETTDECYCSYCKVAFETYLNETILASNWAPNYGDFSTNGSRYNEFAEWRTIPITNLVRDIRSWMLAIRPNLKFSLAAWTLFADSPTYWRYFLGQDTGKWIAEGYLDMVAPMMYTADIPTIDLEMQYDLKYFVGGPEGKIPLAAFLTTGMTVTQFVDVVDEVRLKGADGWIIWSYGGPGVDSGGYLTDITPYLGNLTLPDACRNENITASGITSTTATVTWDSTIDMTSQIEYSAEPFFSAYYMEGWGGFHYWDIDHTPNGTLITNSSKTTSHTITVTGLTIGTTYYYRVQSIGTGTVSSLVFNFTTNNAISVTVTSPTNSTYAVASTISVSFTASGGTIDQYSFNAKNGSSWIYVSNQTGNSGSFTGFVNGASYTGYFWANNTDGTEGVATVMFTVSVIGGTSSIIVNVWWANYW